MRKSVCSIALFAGSQVAFAGFNATMMSATNYDPDTSVMNASLGITGSYVVEDFEDYLFASGLTILVEGTPYANLVCDIEVANEKWDGTCVLHNVNDVPMDGRDVTFTFESGVTEFGVGLAHLEQPTSVLVNGIELIEDITTFANFEAGDEDVRNGYLWITADNGDVIESVIFNGDDMSDTIYFDHAAWLCADASGLVHHWNLEGHPDDIVGGAVGTPNALSYCTDYLPGNVGLGGVFDGTNSFIETDYTPVLGPDDSITFSVWARIDSMPSENDGSVFGLERTNHQELRLLIRGPGGNAHLRIRDDNHNTSLVTSPSNLIDGMWHHYAAVRDGATDETCLFIDGVQVGTDTTVLGDVNAESTLTLSIGANNHKYPDVDAEQDFHFPGMIDELRIYNRALNAEEIRALAAAPCLSGDINEDGIVDVNDLNIVLSNWALSCFR